MRVCLVGVTRAQEGREEDGVVEKILCQSATCPVAVGFARVAVGTCEEVADSILVVDGLGGCSVVSD